MNAVMVRRPQLVAEQAFIDAAFVWLCIVQVVHFALTQLCTCELIFWQRQPFVTASK